MKYTLEQLDPSKIKYGFKRDKHGVQGSYMVKDDGRICVWTFAWIRRCFQLNHKFLQ